MVRASFARLDRWGSGWSGALARRAGEWTGMPFIDALVSHRLAGSPIPPHHDVKLFWLAHFQRRYRLRALVETGTYLGQTVQALSHRFENLYSVELDQDLFESAQAHFAHRPNVHLTRGDSGAVLPDILACTTGRCLFWLDGHYSGPGTARGTVDSPICAELQAIATHSRNDHVILIDDARLFLGCNGYPTMQALTDMLLTINPEYRIRVLDDIVVAQLGVTRE